MGKKKRNSRRDDSDASDNESGKAAAKPVEEEKGDESVDMTKAAASQLTSLLPIWVQHAHDLNAKTKARPLDLLVDSACPSGEKACTIF